MTVAKELKRLADKATEESMVCLGKNAKILESSENAFLAKSKDCFSVVYIKNGRIEFSVFRDEEKASEKMLTVA